MRYVDIFTAMIAAGTALSLSMPAEAKKKKPEPTLFDECPVAETIRVASDASINGLESLAACDDVEVSPADPDDLPMLPKMRAVDNSTDDDQFEVETAELPLRAQGSAAYPANVVNADAVPKRRKKVRSANMPGGTYRLRTTVTGTPFVAFQPEQTEADLSATQVNYSSASSGAMLSSDITGTGSNASAKNLSGDAILSMRPVRYKTGYDDLIGQVAQRHRIDPLLLHAVIKQESGYRYTARSHVGAQGLMQIMPGTGAMLGVRRENLNDPQTNVDAGARLLRKLAIKYDGNFDLVLAAYNAGEGAVQKYGNRIPPYRETQDYVRKVMGNYYQLLNDNTGGAAR